MSANTVTVTAVNTAIQAITSPSTVTLGPLNSLSVFNNPTVTVASSTSHSLDVKGDLNVTGGDIFVDGVSIRKVLEGVVERLHILVPDPAKLEKFAALKQAYDQYKLLEALCHEDEKN